MKEIETLLENKKYSIVLEKSLNILNSMGSQLSPIEAGDLTYYIGMAYKGNDNTEMAITYLKKIEQEFPASKYLKNSYMELADIYKDDYFKRESYLEKVFENYPETSEAITAGLELSKGYLGLKNFKKAVPVLEKLVNTWKVGDQYPELYMLMAVGYSGINDYIEAIDYLRIAEKKVPKLIEGNALYIFEAGKISHNAQNFKKAIKYLGKLINIYPGYKHIVEATILLAQSYEREKNLLLSAVYLIKAAENQELDKKKKYSLMLNLGRVLGKLTPKELSSIKKNHPTYSNPKRLLTIVKENSPIFEYKRTAAILLSELYKRENDYESVIENYYSFLKKKRDPLVERYFKANLDRYIIKLQKDKNYDKIFRFWVIIKDRKSFLSGSNLIKLGNVLFEMELYLNAEEVYRHVRKYRMFSSNWPEADKQCVRIYFKTGKYDQLLKTLSTIKKINPGREEDEFLYYQIFANRELENKDKVKELMNNVTTTNIKNSFQMELLTLKAKTLEDQKNYPQALKIYNDLLTYPPLDESRKMQILLTVANLQYKSDNWQEALDQYNKLEKKGNTVNHDWILFQKFSIYKRTDRLKEAQQELKKLKKKYPDSFWIKQAEKDVR